MEQQKKPENSNIGGGGFGPLRPSNLRVGQPVMRWLAKPKTPWGVLTSIHRDLKSVFLYDSKYTFGRSQENADVSLQDIPNSRFISRTHFSIERNVNRRMQAERPPVYIEDLSFWGTSINGQLIGTGNKRILKTGDVITVEQSRIYRFNDFIIPTHGFPAEITATDFIGNEAAGSGGFGDIYLAHNYETCEKTAIKKIEQTPFVTREVEFMRDLVHPCIVEFRGAYPTPMQMYIRMEYLAGGSLKDLLHRTVFMDEKLAKFIMYQLGSAIEYMHGRGVAHRDIKPANIMLASNDAYPRIKLIDFGISKSTEQMLSVVGSQLYTAPEVLEYEANDIPRANRVPYTEKVDVWAMGIVLYVMFDGDHPFHNDDEILNAPLQFIGLSWLEVSPETRQFITSILMRARVLRPTVSQMLQNQWFTPEVIQLANRVMGNN